MHRIAQVLVTAWHSCTAVSPLRFIFLQRTKIAFSLGNKLQCPFLHTAVSNAECIYAVFSFVLKILTILKVRDIYITARNLVRSKKLHLL
jgi:hypothetical protein